MNGKEKYLTFISAKNAYVDFQKNKHTSMVFRKLNDLSDYAFVTHCGNYRLKSNFPFLKVSHLRAILPTHSGSPTPNKVLIPVFRMFFRYK